MDSTNYFDSVSDDMDNIIRINQSEDENTEEFDYDFDYDPNEMYFALLNENKE